jgi:protein-tyrosine phosphatase
MAAVYQGLSPRLQHRVGGPVKIAQRAAEKGAGAEEARMTLASGLCNIRDVGGLPTDDGGTTRAGVLYRSDAPLPGDPSPDGIATWPPRTVLDLRSDVERTAAPHPLAAGTTVVQPVALMDDATTSGAVGALPSGPDARPWFVALYRRWLDEHPRQIVEAVTAAIRGEPPVLVHCAAGRDRTGVVVALLLRVAGVHRSAVVADYRLTEENQERIVRRLVQSGGMVASYGKLAALRTPEAIEHVLDVVDGYPGGAAGWLVAHGASASDLDGWRARLVATR